MSSVFSPPLHLLYTCLVQLSGLTGLQGRLLAVQGDLDAAIMQVGRRESWCEGEGGCGCEGEGGCGCEGEGRGRVGGRGERVGVGVRERVGVGVRERGEGGCEGEGEWSSCQLPMVCWCSAQFR